MKMRDVFELPVTVVDHYIGETREYPSSMDHHIVDKYDYDMMHNEHQAKAAAHAINMHDELVDGLDSALKMLIKAFDNQISDYNEKSITLTDLGNIHELQTRAKGDCDE